MITNNDPEYYCVSVTKGELIPLSNGLAVDILAHASLNNHNIDVATSCFDEFKRRYENNIKVDKLTRADKAKSAMDFIEEMIIKKLF